MQRLFLIVVLVAPMLAPLARAAEPAPASPGETSAAEVSPPEKSTIAFLGVAPGRNSARVQGALELALAASEALIVRGPAELDQPDVLRPEVRREILMSQDPEFRLPTYAFKLASEYVLLVSAQGEVLQARLFRMPHGTERLTLKLDTTDAAGLKALVQRLVEQIRSDKVAASAKVDPDEAAKAQPPEPAAPQAQIEHVAPTEAASDAPLVLKATIKSDRKFNATIHFRHSSSPEWLQTPMLLKANGVYVAALGPFGSGMIEYFIWVSSDDDNMDKLGTVGTEMQPIRVRLAPKALRSDNDQLTGQPFQAARHSVIGYVTLGAAGVAAVVGTVFGLRARSAGVQSFTTTDAATWQAAKTRALNSSRYATVSWCAAGALGLAGTLLMAFQVTF
jgi:hypothetical protein